jgi:hypothetical protein
MFRYIVLIVIYSSNIWAQGKLEFRNSPTNQSSFYFSEDKILGIEIWNFSTQPVTLCGEYFNSIMNRMPDGSLRFLFSGEQMYSDRPITPGNNDKRQFYKCNSCDFTNSLGSVVIRPNEVYFKGYYHIYATSRNYTFYYKRYSSLNDTVVGKFDFTILKDDITQLAFIDTLELQFKKELKTDTSDSKYERMKAFLDTTTNIYRYKIYDLYIVKYGNKSRNGELPLNLIKNKNDFVKMFKGHTNALVLNTTLNILTRLYETNNKWYSDKKEIEQITKDLFTYFKEIDVNLAYDFCLKCRSYSAIINKQYSDPEYMAKNFHILLHQK